MMKGISHSLLMATIIVVFMPREINAQSTIYVQGWAADTITVFNEDGKMIGDISVEEAEKLDPEVKEYRGGLMKLSYRSGHSVWVHENTVITNEETNVVRPDCAELRVAGDTTQLKGTMNMGGALSCK